MLVYELRMVSLGGVGVVVLVELGFCEELVSYV